MKKYFAIILAAAAAAVACNKEIIEEPNAPAKEVKYIDVQFSSSIEGQKQPDSRTSVGSDGSVSWSSTDKISIFDNSSTATSHNNSFSFAGGQSFSGQLPEDGNAVYALYPQRTGATFKNGVVATKLFPDQNAAVGTFADDVAIMAGKVNGKEIEFKNLCSHIKFTLEQEGIRSLTLMGNKNEVLCGTFNIQWNGDDPSAEVTDPETYVTLRNEDGTALATGDYYFTILPVEFEAGFTVILSKDADGSQVAAKTTSKVDKLSSRNSILEMPAVPSDKFSEHMNYFVKYNDGFDLPVGDIIINKDTNPDGVLIATDMKLAKNDDNGTYFLVPDKTLTINYNETNGLVIIGSDASTRSNTIINKTLQPMTNPEGVIVFKNTTITSSSTFTSDIISQKKAGATNLGTAFGSIIFDNCDIRNIPNNLITMNNAVTSIKNITITDCDCSCTKAGSYIVSFPPSWTETKSDGTKETHDLIGSTLEKLSVENSIFYYSGSAAMTNFRLFNGEKAIIGTVNVKNNTFDNTVIPNTAFVLADKLTNCYIYYNLFNETVLSNSNCNLAIKSSQPTAGQIVSKFFYTKSEKNVIIPTNIREHLEKAGSPVRLSKSPLSSTWNPANGIYGTYELVLSSGEEAPKYKVGAQRADITE